MVNAFELITDIVQVINARPNKAKNSYYKALDSRTGVNGKIPLVRISNHKTHCVTWLGDIRDLGTAMRFPANYYFSIVIENEPSQKDENLPVRVKPFTVHEYTFKQEELEQSDIHAIIQDVIGIFTTGEFANSTGKGKYDPVNAKIVQQAQPTTNNETNESKNMKKNIVKINENTLRKIVAESVKKVLRESNIPRYEQPVFIGCSSPNDADVSVEIGFNDYASSLFYVGECGTDGYAALEAVVEYLIQNGIIDHYTADEELVSEYPDDYIEVNGYYFDRSNIFMHQLVGNHGERRH
jgi:hypothetical protein